MHSIATRSLALPHTDGVRVACCQRKSLAVLAMDNWWSCIVLRPVFARLFSVGSSVMYVKPANSGQHRLAPPLCLAR